MARAFPGHTDAQLEQRLKEKDVPPETRKKMETELAARKAGTSVAFATPQVGRGYDIWKKDDDTTQAAGQRMTTEVLGKLSTTLDGIAKRFDAFCVRADADFKDYGQSAGKKPLFGDLGREKDLAEGRANEKKAEVIKNRAKEAKSQLPYLKSEYKRLGTREAQDRIKAAEDLIEKAKNL